MYNRPSRRAGAPPGSALSAAAPDGTAGLQLPGRGPLPLPPRPPLRLRRASTAIIIIIIIIVNIIICRFSSITVIIIIIIIIIVSYHYCEADAAPDLRPARAAARGPGLAAAPAAAGGGLRGMYNIEWLNLGLDLARPRLIHFILYTRTTPSPTCASGGRTGRPPGPRPGSRSAATGASRL